MGVKSAWLQVFIFVVFPLVAISCVVLGFNWTFSMGAVFNRAYRALEVGMSERQVEELFGGPPEYSCTLDGWSVLHFWSPGSYRDEGNISAHCLDALYVMKDGKAYRVDDRQTRTAISPEEIPRHFKTLKELPVIYSDAQVLIGPDGKVKAYTRMLEEERIHTVFGKTRGSRLNGLNEDFLQRVEEAAGDPLLGDE